MCTQSEISAFCNITTTISWSSWLNLEVLSPSAVAKSGPGFVLTNVHTRGPVKDFQVCIQADTKKGWKADEMWVQSEIFAFGNFYCSVMKFMGAEFGRFSSQIHPQFCIILRFNVLTIYFTIVIINFYSKLYSNIFSKGRMMSYNLSNPVIFHSCFANITASYFSLLLPDAR